MPTSTSLSSCRGHATRAGARAGAIGLAGALTLAAAVPAAAQDTTRTPADTLAAAADTSRRLPLWNCDALPVTQVDFIRQPPNVIRSAPRWSRPFLRALLYGAPTRERAVEPFLLVRGADCSEIERAESERVLRAQPYLADASVRTLPDSQGARVEVRTVDDVRPIAGLRTSGGGVSLLKFGSANVAGYGVRAFGQWERGFALRDGYTFQVEDYAFVGRPVRTAVNLERDPLGSDYWMRTTRPFYTDFQRFAWHADARSAEQFTPFLRPDGSTTMLGVERGQADIGAVVRVGNMRQRLLGGALLSFERREPDSAAVVVTDAGLTTDPDTIFRGRYRTSSTTRLGAVLGLRTLSFAKVRGFDALEGTQDLARGVQLSTIAGYAIAGHGEGAFGTGDLYAGAGNQRMFVGARTLIEAYRFEGEWENVVMSGRLAWYSQPARRETRIASVEYSGAWRGGVPYQLTLGDRRAGVRGYHGGSAAGGRRLVVRGEERVRFPGIRNYLALGGAAFADVGKLWAGDVPYGRTTSARASLGIGLLAAVPRNSRRMGRLDLAVPLTRATGVDSYEVRFTVTTSGRGFWRDPGDLSPARLRPPLANIFYGP